jgi:hypothetical protein
VTGAEIAIRAQPLPDVIDLSIILTGSGFGGLLGAIIGASEDPIWMRSPATASWAPWTTGTLVLGWNDREFQRRRR